MKKILTPGSPGHPAGNVDPYPERATIYSELRRCGDRRCACHRDEARKHGPYWYAAWKERGKLHKRYLGKTPPVAAPPPPVTAPPPFVAVPPVAALPVAVADLVGSNRQIAWAARIRDNTFCAAAAEFGAYQRRLAQLDAIPPGSGSAQAVARQIDEQRDAIAQIVDAVRGLAAETSAKWWIDRSAGGRQLSVVNLWSANPHFSGWLTPAARVEQAILDALQAATQARPASLLRLEHLRPHLEEIGYSRAAVDQALLRLEREFVVDLLIAESPARPTPSERTAGFPHPSGRGFIAYVAYRDA